MKVITVTNQKGGAGKTTTAAAVGAGLANSPKHIIYIDMDAQCNLSYIVKADTNMTTIKDVLTGKATALEAIQHTENGDIIAASPALSGADAYITDTGKEYRLREALEPLQTLYDYCIIDTPPALGVLAVNALTASDTVLIPSQADIFSLQGIERLAETIEPVRRYCNPGLSIAGIVLTRYSPRSVLSREVLDLAGQLAAKLGTRLFKATIREAVAVREAQLSRMSLYDYAPKANVTADYTALVNELLEIVR